MRLQFFPPVLYYQKKESEGRKEGTHPDKKVLNAASAVRPIAILHTSGHMGVVGSMILKMANINEDTPEVDGGTSGVSLAMMCHAGTARECIRCPERHHHQCCLCLL